MLRLRRAGLVFMHTRGLRRRTLGSMLTRLTIIRLGSLLCVLLRLLDRKELLLRDTLLTMGNLLLLEVHHVDLTHSRIRLHGSHLSRIQPLCAIW